MKYYLSALKKYIVFSGRSSIAEFWYFSLFNLVIIFLVGFIDVALGTYNPETNFGLLSQLYAYAILIPSIALSIRRLHDIGKSAWMLLVSFIPLVNIWLLFLFAKKGDSGKNKYGPSPKKIEK
jgi:uncharacterized membrane protein YhaH (DUF805 family)